MSTATACAKNRRSDRRRYPRNGTKITCVKGSLGLGKNLALELLDISETGIRLVLTAALDPKQEIEVTLLGPSQSRPIKVLGQVMWCVAAADGTFCVGARLSKRLGYRDFLALSK